MDELTLQQKSLKLLDILTRNAELGDDNVKYLSFVLQAWYDDGYKDAIYSVVKPTKLKKSKTDLKLV